MANVDIRQAASDEHDSDSVAKRVVLVQPTGDYVDNAHPVQVDVVAGNITIDPGDIEIGAVEIKNATDDTRAVVSTNNALKTVLYDLADNELDFRAENENWNAADHGILVFGRDMESAPNKYRAIRLDGDGRVETHLCNAAHDVFEFDNIDFDTGGGTDNISIVGIALPASGGAVAGGTSTNPIRTDPTGTTAQPVTDNGGALTVDGSVTVTQGTGTNLHVVVDSGAVTVSATDLDIRNLVFATDKVDASGSTLGSNSGVDIGDVTVNNSTGAAAVNIQDGGNTITVDGTVAVSSITTSVTPGSAAANLGKIEDGGHTTGDVGVMALGVANTADANISGTTLDYTPFATDLTGAVHVMGKVAADAAVPANPLFVGTRASWAAPTAMSADGDLVGAWSTRKGATVISNPVGTRTTGTVDLTAASTTYRITTSSTWVENFWVQSKGTNVGTITVGSSGTYASNYVELRPGQMWYLGTVDISLIYYGSTAAGDDINYSYTA